MAIQFEPQQEQPQQEKTYKVRDTFYGPYTINRAGNGEVILSGFLGNNRHTAPIKVGNDMRITQSEFDELTCGASSDFTQVDFKLTQLPEQEKGIRQFVKNWVYKHAINTFALNWKGKHIYELGDSSIDLVDFFEKLLQSYIAEQSKETPNGNQI